MHNIPSSCFPFSGCAFKPAREMVAAAKARGATLLLPEDVLVSHSLDEAQVRLGYTLYRTTSRLWLH